MEDFWTPGLGWDSSLNMYPCSFQSWLYIKPLTLTLCSVKVGHKQITTGYSEWEWLSYSFAKYGNYPFKERANIYYLSLIGHGTVNLGFKSWTIWGLSVTLLEMCGNGGNLLLGIGEPLQMKSQGMEYRGLRQQYRQSREQKPGLRTVFCDNREEGVCSDPEQRTSCVQNTCTSNQWEDGYMKSWAGNDWKLVVWVRYSFKGQ